MEKIILDERYELLEHIGSGGMAEVYKAQDLILERLVAIKILNAQYSGDKEFVQRFHREARGAARLSHPNIVGVYDVGEDDGRHYIVMELVEGKTLKNLIEEQGKLSIEDSLHIAKKIAAALEMAHKNNLVHCDIKPHNILVTANGAVKVADFGIARAVSSSTMTYNDTVVGSVHYFSPEQAKGSAITPKSDVYSLGVVLYEMLTGQLPFNGSTPVGIALKHLQEEAVSLRNIDESIPGKIDAIVMRAMEKNRDDRPDSTELFRMIESLERQVALGTVNEPSPDPFATQVIPRVQVPDKADDEPDDEYEYEDDEEDNGSFGSIKELFKTRRFKIIAVLILVLGFSVGAFLSFGEFWSTSEVTVPNVVGKQMALAKQILEDKNLRVKLAEAYSADVPAGSVVSQYPEADSKVKGQRQITIYISKGGEEIEMPDLKGMSRSAAEERLKKSGLKVGSIKEAFSNDEKETVINQTPAYRTKIAKGQMVDLVVSKGAEVKDVVVPDFRGATLEFARSNTASLKLKIGSISRRTSGQPEGTIISQTPAARSSVKEGTVIDFVVSAGSDTHYNRTETPVKAPSKDNDFGKTK